MGLAETVEDENEGLYGFEGRENDKRRVDPEERKTYDIEQLWQRHHEILTLAAEGFKNVEIAKILALDPQTVSNTINSQLGLVKLSELRKVKDGDARLRLEQIRVLTDKAIRTYNEILDNESREATLKDRKDVADRVISDLSGLKVPTRLVASHGVAVLTAEQLADFKQRGIAAAREAGLVIDVKTEEDGNGTPVEQEATGDQGEG